MPTELQPIIILSDGQSYDNAENCELMLLNSKGQTHLLRHDEPPANNEGVVCRVPISALWDLWVKTRGLQILPPITEKESEKIWADFYGR